MLYYKCSNEKHNDKYLGKKKCKLNSLFSFNTTICCDHPISTLDALSYTINHNSLLDQYLEMKEDFPA